MTKNTSISGKLKVLIIDDDKISNFIYKKIIAASQVSHSIDSFLRANEALDYLTNCINEDSFPDLIFLDINMPIMNGWEFLELYIADIWSKIKNKPVLCMLSSSVYEEDIDKALSYHVVSEYIAKPLSVERLHEIEKKHFSN